MSTWVWYCAELDKFIFDGYPPSEILSTPGWKQYSYWAVPPAGVKARSNTGLVEYIYIGEL